MQMTHCPDERLLGSVFALALRQPQPAQEMKQAILVQAHDAGKRFNVAVKYSLNL